MTKARSVRRILVTGAVAGLVLLPLSSWAQNTINARISGGGGGGKCTFEVRVDGVANVQIRGNQGYIQTKTGMPAQWVRLQCNQPLPRNPNNFRFAGVDGRGKQYLLKSPTLTMAWPSSASKITAPAWRIHGRHFLERRQQQRRPVERRLVAGQLERRRRMGRRRPDASPARPVEQHTSPEVPEQRSQQI